METTHSLHSDKTRLQPPWRSACVPTLDAVEDECPVLRLVEDCRMRTFVSLLLLLTIISLRGRDDPPARQPDPFDKTATIKVPEGFVVERVAGPPVVEHPVMACFDERGRLFVAENAGVNLKADELLKNLPSKILLLEDTQGDGHFD